MPQFKQVAPYYMPAERNDTQAHLNTHLVAALGGALDSMRANADKKHREFVRGADGIQWLCYELRVKLDKGNVVAPTDVNDVVSTLPQLKELVQDSFAGTIILDLKSIYAAHCENVALVNSLVIQHGNGASASYSALSAELAGISLDASASASQTSLRPNTLYSGLLPEPQTISYRQLAELVSDTASAHPTQGLLSGAEILAKIEVIENEVSGLVGTGKENEALLAMLGLCVRLASDVKRTRDLSEHVVDPTVAEGMIDAEVAKMDSVVAVMAANYIDRLKLACCGRDQVIKSKFVRALNDYIAERAKHKDTSGQTKEFLHSSMLSLWQNSFSQEKRAVKTLIEAVWGNGTRDELSNCLQVLQRGGLAATINPLIQERALLEAVRKDGTVSINAGRKISVEDFVNILTMPAGTTMQFK